LEEKEKLEEELEEMQSKSKDEIYEDFMRFIEIDDPAKYKRKAKGLRLAFDVKDTKSRIPIVLQEIKTKKSFKSTSKLSAAEIKEKMQKMKNQRLEKKLKQEFSEKVKYDKNREYLKQIHEKLRHDKLVKPVKNKISYTDIKIRNMGIPNWEGKNTKVTLDVLKNMHYSDFNINDDDDFKPTDILDENDLRELQDQEMRIKRKKNRSVNRQSNLSEHPKNSAKRGVQLNQSQMAEYRNNSTLAKPIHKGANEAYDYTQGTMNDASTKKSIHIMNRDERSVPRLAQSFDGDNLYGNKAAYPRSKQAVISKRLAIAGSHTDIKPNKSVHYRRGTHGGYPNIKIEDTYPSGGAGLKLPYMKQKMKDRAKQIENSHRAKEKRNMDGIMLMHDKHISKGLKTIDKNRYK
jgi:hypothetical protein